MCKVVIIILNWNGWLDTVECLESLFQISYPDFTVIVVDNGSKDDSIERIRDYCSGKIQVESPFFIFSSSNKPIKIIEYSYDISKNSFSSDYSVQEYLHSLILIKNPKNSGFSGGNNIGIKFSLEVLNPDYILLLNNDTVVDPQFLDKLIEVTEREKEIVIVGPKIYFYNYSGKSNLIQSIGGTINWEKYPGYFHVGKFSVDTNDTIYGSRETDWISGCALMLRVKESPIKFLNNDFFFGCEDIDLCLQLKNEGYSVLIALESKIWHKGGISRKKRSSIIIKKIMFDLLTNIRLFKRYHKDSSWKCGPYLFGFALNISRLFINKIIK